MAKSDEARHTVLAVAGGYDTRTTKNTSLRLKKQPSCGAKGSQERGGQPWQQWCSRCQVRGSSRIKFGGFSILYCRFGLTFVFADALDRCIYHAQASVHESEHAAYLIAPQTSADVRSLPLSCRHSLSSYNIRNLISLSCNHKLHFIWRSL